MIEVELPDGTIAEFPDGTAPETIKSALKKRYSQQEEGPGRLASFGTGVASGLTFGFDDEIAAGINTLFGFRGDYGEELERQRAMQGEARAAHPGYAVAGDVTGAIGSGIAAAPLSLG